MLKTVLTLCLIGFIAILGYLYYPLFVVTGSPLLIVNMWNEEALPKNFRSTSDSVTKNENSPNFLGLQELHASGSSQFSKQSLKALLQKLPSRQLTLVDLRQESHGFINGIAVSWYTERDWVNKGKSLTQVVEDEIKRLKEISKHYFTIVFAHKKFAIPLWVSETLLEEELAVQEGIDYIRIPVTDHLRPTDQDVDLFIQFIKTLPKEGTWLHFHCAAGEGRTTTFLVMYDMIRNAGKVKIEDIFLRQHLLGGINFLNEKAIDWKRKYAEQRKVFLYQFYTYCLQNPLLHKSWTEWIKEQERDIEKK